MNVGLEHVRYTSEGKKYYIILSSLLGLGSFFIFHSGQQTLHFLTLNLPQVDLRCPHGTVQRSSPTVL